jgi:acetyl-CoA carboxylase biotin carboxyl carrier protein
MMQIEQVRELSEWLAATDIGLLELSGPQTLVRLRRDGGEAVVVEQGAATESAEAKVAKASSVGVFLHRHPLQEAALAPVGARVSRGQVLGLLQIGSLLLPVYAPCDGFVTGVLVPHGTAVGYGTPLVELRCVS